MKRTAWIFQKQRDIRKHGSDNAVWHVGWYDLSGKRHGESCGPGIGGKRLASRRRDRIEAELELEVHQPKTRHKWSQFRKVYEERVVDHMPVQSRSQVVAVLNHFERILKPGLMENVTTAKIDDFVSARRKEPGKKPKSKLSVATINKDLRHIKAILRLAVDWEYLRKMPKIRMLREPEKMVSYVTPEHFALLYIEAAKHALKPVIALNTYTTEQWWQALFVMGYMTGWRIKEIMTLRWQDVDLDKATVLTRHADNKGRRDELVSIHSAVVEHLQKIKSDDRYVFPWPHDHTDLWKESERIQAAAGIHLVCREDHEHTPYCHVYGFHDLRRAFATVNAPKMKPEVLQKLMRHRSYRTTLGYVNQSQQIEDAVKEIKVPDILKIDER